MPMLTWSIKLSVGVKTFDDDHKKLVGLLNTLFDAMQAGKGRDVLGKILNELVQYTKFHFSREEEQMAKLGYPNLITHRNAHADLMRQLGDIQIKYNSGVSAGLTGEVLNFLNAWLVDHIQVTDQRYGPFFKSKGLA